MIMVTEFTGYREQREQAYNFKKLRSDPTFEGSRCTVGVW